MTTPFEDLAGADEETGYDEETGEDESGDDESGEDESGAVYVTSSAVDQNPFVDGVRKDLPFELTFSAAGTLTLAVYPDDAAFWPDTLLITSNGSTCTMSTPLIGTTPVLGGVGTLDLSAFSPANISTVQGNFPCARAISIAAQFKASVANTAGTVLRGKFVGWSSPTGRLKKSKPKKAIRRGRRGRGRPRVR